VTTTGSARRFTVLFDCGDTLVDEATEVKDARGATLRAELIPGAADTVRELHRRGYRLGLVADGFVDTFRNVLTQHGLWDLFSAMAISENGLGLVSVWLRWSPRRSKVPADSSEVPAWTIDTPTELLVLLERLEAESP
jgi:FMN phosphatase YigB (HAD superfamily)